MTALTLALVLAVTDGGRPAASPPDGGGLALALDGGAPVSDGGFDPTRPATWTLSARLPRGSAERKALVRDLTADAGRSTTGEQALTVAEAEALLDDPRADLVYADRTIQVVAPSMTTRHRQEHLDVTPLFLAPDRVDAGVQFIARHRATLETAHRRHRVDPEVVVAILMWESKLGEITGSWLAFNALASQAFFADAASQVAMATPEERARTEVSAQARRAATISRRGRANLVALVRQSRARGIDPLTIKGSWAGALGFPQFMPRSLQWAEDGDGDGTIDLFSFPDAIASVARYLAAHGFAKSPRRAVWGYNHEGAYVDGVLAYADALRHALSGAQFDGGAK